MGNMNFQCLAKKEIWEEVVGRNCFFLAMIQNHVQKKEEEEAAAEELAMASHLELILGTLFYTAGAMEILQFRYHM